MSEIEIIIIILEFLTLLFVIYLSFVKSYVNEKGKQLAILENVEELTKKVENIKSEIDFFTRLKFDLATSERSAILDFHEKYFDWRNSITGLYPSLVNESNYSSVSKLFESIRNKELIMKNSEQRLKILINTDELIELRSALFKLCMRIRHVAETHFQKIALEYDLLTIEKNSSPIEMHKAIQENRLKNISNIHQSFGDQQIELYEKIIPIEAKMNQKLKEVLFEKVD